MSRDLGIVLCLYICLWITSAPNLSWYDSKLLPSVKYDWIIASNLGAVDAGVEFLTMKSLEVWSLKVLCSRDLMDYGIVMDGLAPNLSNIWR